MSEHIEYGHLMHSAMRSLIRTVLTDVAQNGLPGEHHFFITFDTTHPEAQLADWLHERYPEEMTVVIQHWFENLEVSEDAFAITLNFGNSPEPLYIPLDAIRTFVDPSVEFGLRFESQEDEDEEAQDAPESEPQDSDDTPESGDAEVVSLDSFRK